MVFCGFGSGFQSRQPVRASVIQPGFSSSAVAGCAAKTIRAAVQNHPRIEAFQRFTTLMIMMRARGGRRKTYGFPPAETSGRAQPCWPRSWRGWCRWRLVCRDLFEPSCRGFPTAAQLRPDDPSSFRLVAMASLGDRAEEAAVFVADTPLVGAS